MADAVKITDLPAISSLTPNDIVPVVDESETQTSRATLSQIQELGPGSNTVSDEHVRNGHIPAAKSGFTTRNKIIWSGPTDPALVVNSVVSATPEGQSPIVSDDTEEVSVDRYQGQELPLTDFGAQMISARNATEGAALINAGREFTDGIFVSGGSAAYPSYSWIDDPNSGWYSDTPGTIQYSSAGARVFQLSPDGTLYTAQYPSPIPGQPITIDELKLVPRYGVVCYASLKSSVQGTTYVLSGAGAVFSYFRNLYGYVSSSINPDTNNKGDALSWNRCIGDLAADSSIGQAASAGNESTNQNNVNGIYKLNSTTAVNSPLFNFLSGPSNNFVNIYASRRDPHHYSFTGTVTNFHSPEDDYHWAVNGSTGAVELPVVGPNKFNSPWIGYMSFQQPAANFELIRHQNVGSVELVSGTNHYRFTFLNPMPDDKYCVLHGFQNSSVVNAYQMTCIAKNKAYFEVAFTQGTATTEPSNVPDAHDIIVVR